MSRSEDRRRAVQGAPDRTAWIGWRTYGDGERVCEWLWCDDESEARRRLASLLDIDEDDAGDDDVFWVERAAALDGMRHGTESAAALRSLHVIDPEAEVCGTCCGNDPTGREPHYDVCGGCDQCGECGCTCEEGDDA